MISDDKFQEIIDKTDIVSLVGEYVDLTKKGSGYFGLCPFHDDSSPSFSVSPDKKIAMCMTCKEGGNPITFLKKIKKISFIEAASILAEKASVKLDVDIKPKKEDKNQKYYDIYQVAQEFYVYNLYNSQTGEKALEYLYKRGLTDDTIKMFGIGLAPNNRDTLKNVLYDKGFVDIDCIEVGLLKNNDKDIYDIFINRIVFPITNENGQTIAFSGRLYDGSNGPKYVNTMETVIYRKGDHLYNLSNAIPQINKTKTVILCEGQMDAIKIATTKLTDVVCALGSALTTNQVKLIKKYAKNVVLAYDNDNAGVQATITAIKLLEGLKVDVMIFPQGFDPDDYINSYSVESFHRLYNERIDSIEFMYNSYFIGKNTYSFVDVEEIKNNLFNYINTMKSNTVQSKLINKLSNDLQISYDILLKDYNNYFNKPHTKVFVEKEPEPIKKITIDKALEDATKSLLGLMLMSPDNVALTYEYSNGLKFDQILIDPYNVVYDAILYAYRIKPDAITKDIIGHFKFENKIDLLMPVIDEVGFISAKTPKEQKQILKDSIYYIDRRFREDNIRNNNPTSNNVDIGSLNTKLENARELDLIKKTKK